MGGKCVLTGKQSRYLRSLAHPLQAIMQVGKGGVTENLLDQLGLALEARELIKVSVLQNCELTVREVADELSAGTKSDVVQVIGKTIVIYRKSHDHKTIVLPR
jgi:RNA-binding protein